MRTRLARVTPTQPFARMIRSTVHRATVMPCRCRCAHIFSDPYNDSGFRRPCSSGSYSPAMTSVITRSDRARFDGARLAQAQYVLGAIWQPCAVSARQIGATPDLTRCSAMNRQINGVAGRTPARRKTLQP